MAERVVPSEALREKLRHLPTAPGVYMHRDATGKVLYVGKAKNLRNRVRSYFQERRPRDRRLQVLISKIADVEVIVTDTEAEALILENNLIKELKPRYNINLRDDKSYPYICITNEPFPRVFSTRRVRKDGSRYFGPYTDVGHMKWLLRTIRSIFKIRSCTLNLTPEAIAAGKFRSCLDYQIGKCAAPCVGLQTMEAYQATIRQIEQLLQGKTDQLIEQLDQEMRELAAAMRFEEAAALRDQIQALRSYAQRQKVVSMDRVDRDLFAVVVDEEQDVACGVVFRIREGKMVGRQHTYLRQVKGWELSSLMQSWVEHYYLEASFIPDEVLLSTELEFPEAVQDFLKERKGKRVMVRVPQRGDKAALMRMVENNASLLLSEFLLQRQKRDGEFIPWAVQSLQRDLRLEHSPLHIECFDVSHLGGTDTVASCVVFKQARPRRSEYRVFNIRSTEGKPDDFAAMHEAVYRRYRRVKEEGGALPDLIVIDGGKGQLSSAVHALKELGIYEHVVVIGLAKRLEEVFFPGDSEGWMIPRTSSSLRLLQRVRDEAHRMAVTSQRRRRTRTHLHSQLTEIPGIGERRAHQLLKHFGSVRSIQQASEEEIARVVGPSLARRIKRYFQSTRAQGYAE